MLKIVASALFACLLLSACSSNDEPVIVQASPNMKSVQVTQGMATQIELPAGRVQSVTVGNPDLLTATRDADVVNLIGKNGTGETNLIIRSTDDDNRPKLYQYRITVVQP